MVAQLDSLYIRTSPRKALARLISYAFFEGRPLTTKGQWINPLLSSLFAIQKRLPQLRAVHKPIFIIGTGRSGTTILGTLLSMHREVGFLNEPKALWHAIYPQEDLVGSYSRGPAKYRLTSREASERVHQTAHRLFGAYLAVIASKRVVDKYPELVFRVPFVKTLFPDAKFIFLVRNGWDTCQSIEGWSQRQGVQVQTEQHDWWGADNRKWELLWEQIIVTDEELKDILPEREPLEHPLNMAVLEWIVSMQEGLRCMNQFPGCIHKLRYEDLVSQPRTTLTQVLQFCELPPDERFLNYASQRLAPVASRGTFEFHPALRPHFDKLMKALDYSR